MVCCAHQYRPLVVHPLKNLILLGVQFTWLKRTYTLHLLDFLSTVCLKKLLCLKLFTYVISTDHCIYQIKFFFNMVSDLNMYVMQCNHKWNTMHLSLLLHCKSSFYSYALNKF